MTHNEEIKKLSADDARALLESGDEKGRNYKPLGLFYTEDTDTDTGETWWTGIDNLDGNAFTENFKSLEACKRWLRDDSLTVPEAEIRSEGESAMPNEFAESYRKFAVVFTYNFDEDCSILSFRTEDEARKFLQNAFEAELRIEREENGWEVTAEHNDDWSYAKITHPFEDEVEICEYHMNVIEEM